MEPSRLGLPPSEGPVEVRRTHLSEVFLTRSFAIKTKRAVTLPFVDFATREARAAACEAEVRLNRRLAPDVYLDVITLPDGEPAVRMRRLPDDASLLAMVESGRADAALLRAVAERVAAFHADAETGPEIARFGSAAAVIGNAVDNFEQTLDQVGVAVHPDVHRRAREATEVLGAALAPTFDTRAASGRVRDTHGDLRLEHVYWLDGRVVVIDCIEFADRFRYADVAADAAFLAMDLQVRSRPDLARVFTETWLAATGDHEARCTWDFYVAYRSAVRAKVAGMTLGDPALTDARRASQQVRSSRHWLLTWSALAPASVRPALVAVGGRPGTGKSTVARMVADTLGFEVIRSDVVRKELAGLAPTASAAAPVGEGLYTPEGKARVYEACFERASEALFAGRRVLLDATFLEDRWRERLRALGERWAVPAVLLRCEAPDELVRERIAARSGDASDADVAVFERSVWEPEGAATAPLVRAVSTAGTPAETLKAAVAALDQGFAESAASSS